jgi:hypothetical protein
MKLALAAAAAFATLTLISEKLFAYTNWVNDFTTSFIRMNQSDATGHGSLTPFWANDNPNVQNYQWELVGAQYIGARANVKEHVETDLREVYPSDCFNATIELSRWRDTSPPGINSSCSSSSTTGNTFIGTATYTISTCGNGNNDNTYSHRSQPVFDFSAEGSAPVGSTWGYISRTRVTVTRGDGSNMISGIDSFTCYRVWWFAA